MSISGILILALFLSLTIVSAAQGRVLISEVYADTKMKGEPDEFIAIQNFGDTPVNISGWRISDGEGTFMLESTIQPHQKIYITRNASAFDAEFEADGINADFEWTGSSSISLHGEGMFALRNAGDEVVLLDSHGNVVDSIAFGDSDGCRGWHDEPLPKAPEGHMLKRKCSTDTTATDITDITDTDRKCDWVVLPVHMPCFCAEIFYAQEICAFVSPDCSFEVIAGEFSNASSYILVNTYEFESLTLKDLLKNAIMRGVDVKILMERRPIGGMSDKAIAIIRELRDAGADIRLLNLHNAVNHAKYVVIDGESVIVMSENLKDSGFPEERTYGNRGFGAVLRSEKLAEHFKTLFYADFNSDYAVSAEDARYYAYCENEKYEYEYEYEKSAYKRSMRSGGSAYEPVFRKICVEHNISVKALIAPDNMLDAILSAFEDAEHRIYVALLSSEKIWDDRNSCSFACTSGDINPLLNALINAARRGCDVKVLLDSNYLKGDNDNDDVAEWLNALAKKENISLKAEIADLNALKLFKIHCKCAVIDDKVLISSMNWKSGATCNREAGVIVENRRIADYYADVFMHDWNLSRHMSRGAYGAYPVSRAVSRAVGIALTFAASFLIFMLIRRFRS